MNRLAKAGSAEVSFLQATGRPKANTVPPSVTEWAASFNSAALDGIQQQISLRRAESEYVGFNVKKLLERIKTLANNPVFPTVQEDIAYGVMLFLERGSSVVAKTSADTARMSREGFNQMTKFIKHYQIAPRVKGATTITLPRWSLCFPLMTVAYCEQRANFIVPVPNGFPKALTSSAGLSSIRGDESLLKAYCWYQREISLVINKDFGYKSDADQKKEIMKYATISQNSNILSANDIGAAANEFMDYVNETVTTAAATWDALGQPKTV
ncbi:unnamed protein product [Bemisia tabaci]|uniref:Nucleocapsid protein n=1 Tax=Bemisia tabaci TaxID=7038 RepID=A0A9P0F2Z1_BEMTA|nr:unnamed protein product [Bemisia tabaci]